MLSTSEFRSRRQLFSVAAITWAILTVSWHGMAVADPTEDFLAERAVRVIVRGVNPNTAASGFLWQQNNWVVTNLHAIPSNKNIKVSCGGLIQSAKVEKVLPSADLALLVVDPPADGRLALHRCKPFTDADFEDPGLGANLTTYGWMGDARKGLPRFMKKSTTGRLADRFGSNTVVLKALDEYGIPDIENVDFYILQGGTFPGYSGAGIVNNDSELVAIVDGGLNEGMNTINWAIPAENLTKLVRDGVKWQPRYGEKPAWLWSDGFADPDENSVLEYREKDWFTDIEYDYNWVRTKRLSLRQLAQSSMDPEGILALLTIYGEAAGGDLDPVFDVYEDLDQGLIIAVPADQGLSMELMFPPDPRFKGLSSKAVPVDVGEITYRQTNTQVTSSSTGKQISPNDSGFFNEKVSELLSECSDFGAWSCEIDPPTLRVIRFDNGDQILKAGFKQKRVDGPEDDRYTYYSFAVHDGTTFLAEASFLTPRGRAGLIQCTIDPGSAACADPKTAMTQLTQMLAVHLTTFSYPDPWSGRSLETRIEFDSSADDPSTIRTPYFEGDQVRFFNSRGKIWIENCEYIEEITVPGHEPETNTISMTTEFLEYDRDANYVYVEASESGKTTIKIPINGGKYRRSSNGCFGEKSGRLKRK